MDLKELYWAAGFLEGEGSFPWRKAPHNQFAIQASQVDPESLYRLRQHWGGTVYGPLTPRDPKKHKPFFAWFLGGPKAAAFAMMLYSQMTGRRQEKIKFALAEWRKVQFGPRHKTICKRGHDLKNARLSTKGVRHCRECSALRNKKHRAAKREIQELTVH